MGDTFDGAEASHCPSELIEIDIKRLCSETYTLRVYRSISILELKERIADLSGVTSRLQRLIFRGRVLRDDQLLLSDYHVEGGQTLYLVVRPPIPRLSQIPTSDPILSRVDSQREQGSLLIPDALLLVSAYQNHLRRNNSQTPRNSVGDSGPTRENQITGPSLLARVQQTRRQLLIGEVAACLSNISMVLADRVNLRDPSSQRLRQGRAVESATRLSELGNTLTQLGRVISRTGMGERPVIYVAPLLQIQIPLSWLQTSDGAGNIPLATVPRNVVITRENEVRFHWPSPSSQQQVLLASSESESQNAVNTSSPQLTTEAEVEDSGSEDEMRQ